MDDASGDAVGVRGHVVGVTPEEVGEEGESLHLGSDEITSESGVMPQGQGLEVGDNLRRDSGR
jgi:hypothetical protein